MPLWRTDRQVAVRLKMVWLPSTCRMETKGDKTISSMPWFRPKSFRTTSSSSPHHQEIAWKTWTTWLPTSILPILSTNETSEQQLEGQGKGWSKTEVRQGQTWAIQIYRSRQTKRTIWTWRWVLHTKAITLMATQRRLKTQPWVNLLILINTEKTKLWWLSNWYPSPTSRLIPQESKLSWLTRTWSLAVGLYILRKLTLRVHFSSQK